MAETKEERICWCKCRSLLFVVMVNPGRGYMQWKALLFVQGLTGFAMFWPDGVLGFVISILGNMAYVRALHLVILYAILGLVVIHLYMALIPQNRETLKSIFLGKARERVHKST